MEELNTVFQSFADAIRLRLGTVDKIKPIDFAKNILLIADYGFATNMVDGSGSGTSIIEKIIIDKSVTSISNNAFSGLKISNIELHDGVTSIGNNAFSSCSNLYSIDLKNVKTIGTSAFSLTRIQNIYIPASVTSLEGGNNSAFTQIPALKEIIVSEDNPNYYSKVGDKEYNVCIKNIYSAGNKKYANALIFGCVNTEIPEGVTYIHGDAMSSNRCPETLALPYTMSLISGRAFFNSTNLKKLRVNSSIKYNNYAFSGVGTIELFIPNLSAWCASTMVEAEGNPMYSGISSSIPTSKLYINQDGEDILLENMEIPNDVTTLNKYIFIGCASLRTVKFHSNIKSIQEYAFGYCTNISLYDFSALDTPPSLTNVNAFYGKHPEKWYIIVKNGTKDLWIDANEPTATNWCTFSDNIYTEEEYNNLNQQI